MGAEMLAKIRRSVRVGMESEIVEENYRRESAIDQSRRIQNFCGTKRP